MDIKIKVLSNDLMVMRQLPNGVKIDYIANDRAIFISWFMGMLVEFGQVWITILAESDIADVMLADCQIAEHLAAA